MNYNNVIKIKVAGKAEPVNILDDKATELELSDAKVINKNLNDMDLKIKETEDAIRQNEKDAKTLEESIKASTDKINDLINDPQRTAITDNLDAEGKLIANKKALLEEKLKMANTYLTPEEKAIPFNKTLINKMTKDIVGYEKDIKHISEAISAINTPIFGEGGELSKLTKTKESLELKQTKLANEMKELEKQKAMKTLKANALKATGAIAGGLGAAALSNVGNFTGSQSAQNNANNALNLASKGLLLKANPIVGASIIALETANNALNEVKELKQELEESKRKTERLGGVYEL